MVFQLRDATLKVTKALPAAPGAVNSDGIDLGAKSARAEFLAKTELLISAPILTTTELPDTKTVVYKVEHDDDVAFGTVATLADSVLVQTGAGGAGAAAATVRFRFPSSVKRYVRITATQNTTAADQSGKSLTGELLF